MNAAKTEHTILRRCLTPASADPHARAEEEAWRSTRKLGSLLGDADDVSRRKILAAAALRRLWTVWLRSHRITDTTRIPLYNCYVLPILLYNCGTWALIPTELHRLESFHHRRLRSRPLRHRITSARWGLLGHILRRPQDIPAFIQMKAYFSSSDSSKWRGRPRTTLPLVLDQDLDARDSTYEDTTLCRRRD
ncbi:hypothetical protein PHYSODRAFT_480033 [Phytophthora sojae]|uniref:Uncharacterized protein n=1 Tax=Phytophthora sojae (strain P6497) TaxID=1094619 RepID=G4Z0Y6_PHYSP|nr:hypothetical protein PHYSODRAFT_480033 [Phytophthora sojae]EGZ23411.1 hypothetical protein PHYSODRAFT_480033 [Phytophthora sojae]|eukprot:XP_009518699.1 hypothetical protein PHYSODRAFT_480033 [Phytophthora sojae]